MFQMFRNVPLMFRSKGTLSNTGYCYQAESFPIWKYRIKTV